MLPLSRRIAVSANVIFFPCTRLEIKFILSYLILVLAPFHQSLVRERQLIFHLSGINAAINHY